jgi:phosphatidylinositol glycan class V
MALPRRSGAAASVSASSADSEARAVLCLAVLSRVAVVLLAALARRLAPPYDAAPALPPSERLPAPLAALLSWDGQHFLRIARGGYALEQLHAFFPLYPLLVARGADALQRLLPPLRPPREREAALALAALLLSNACFVLAARLLLALGRLVLGDGTEERQFAGSRAQLPRSAPSPTEPAAPAMQSAPEVLPVAATTTTLPAVAALLFCVAPSGVFMSAAYSESLFAALSFAGMVAAERAAAAASAAAAATTGRRASAWTRAAAAALWLCAAATAFALAAATRSNGILLAGYIAFAALRIAAAVAAVSGATPGTAAGPTAALAVLAGGVLLCIAVALPLAAFEALGHWTYCADAPPWARALAAAALPPSWGGLPAAAASPRPAWCGSAPLLYAHVQRAYWGVGLLRYWQARHAGMFLLAAPALALAVLAARRFLPGGDAAATAWRGLQRLVGGLLVRGTGAALVGASEAKGPAAEEEDSAAAAAAAVAVATGAAALRELPYALHVAALALAALLAMHVQVATRVLTACPALFWAAARLARGPRGRPRLVLAFFLGYSCVGTVLFAAHYNWT